jgi:hypothetical protein
MVQESPTAQGVQAEPAPFTAAVAEPPTEPQPTAVTEPEQPAPEAGEDVPEETTPQWTSPDGEVYKDEFAVLDHPKIKETNRFRDERMRNELQQSYNTRYEKATKDWESLQAHQTINGLVGNLQARLDESNFDGADRIIAKLEKFREPYMESYERQIQDIAGLRKSNEVFGLLMEGLDMRGQHELNVLAQTTGDWKKIVAKRDEILASGVKETAKQAGLKEGKAAKAAQQPAGPGAGVLAPGSSAGGKSDAEILADPSTPVSKLMEIRARQRAAGE